MFPPITGNGALLRIVFPISLLLSLTMIFLGLKTFLVVSCAIFLLALLFIRFHIAVMIYIIIVPITIHFPSDIHHAISYSLSAILVFSWLIKKFMLGDRFSRVNFSLLLFMATYIVWGIMCSLQSHYISTGLFVTLRQLLFFCIFYVFYDWMKSSKEIELAIDSMIAMGIIASLPVLFQVFSYGLGNVFRFQAPVRFAGLYTGVNALAMHLSFILPIGLSRFIRRDSVRRKWFDLLGITLISIALFFTFSRSAWLLAVVSTGIILVYFKKTKLFIFIAVLFVLILSLYSAEIIQIIEFLVRIEHGVSQREILWKGAISIIETHPISGVGPGAFKYFIAEHAPAVPWRWPVLRFGGIVGADAHNLFLTKGAELGIVGIALILYFFVYYFRIYWKAKKNLKTKEMEYVLIAALATVIGALARSFFEGKGVISGGVGWDLFFWLLIAFTLRVELWTARGRKYHKT